MQIEYFKCDRCDGTGMLPTPSTADCPDCDGFGILDDKGYPPLEEEE